jgi:hypothetical protein
MGEKLASFIDFSTRKSEKGFPYQYTPLEEDRKWQEEARGLASSLGQTIEDIACRAISKKPDVIIKDFVRNRSRVCLDSIVRPLASKVRSAPIDGHRTISRADVIPFYMEAFEERADELKTLASVADEIQGTDLSAKLKALKEEYHPEAENRAAKAKISYLIDGIAIITRLTLDGIGEDLPRMFGDFLPDVKFRDRNNWNTDVTQFDGIFLPKGPKPIMELDGSLEREIYLLDVAVPDHPDYPPETPPVLNVPGLLEIKTLFRPRWTAGKLSTNIPPHELREITQRLGDAYTFSEIAIVPQAIIFLRLRSLAPNVINIFHPNLSFYAPWRDAVIDQFQKTNDFFETDKVRLANFMFFLDSHARMLLNREEERLANNGHVDFDSKAAKQARIPLKGVERLSKAKRKRLKREKDELLQTDRKV